MKKVFLLLLMLPLFALSQTELASAATESKNTTLVSPKIVVMDDAEELICDFYPNPSTGLIHTYCSSNIISYTVVDKNGKTVYTKSSSENVKIKMSEIPAGLYVINIEDIYHRQSSKQITITY